MIGRRKNTARQVPPWSIAFRAPDSTHTFRARIPTNADGLWFEGVFELIVSWNGAGAQARARATARLQREVIRVASGEGTRYCLGDRGTAEAEIACAFSEARTFQEDAVRDVAVSVTLTADEEDLELERERERVGPRREVHKALHRVRMERVGELRYDVLSDPQVARVWWYEQNPEQLHDIEEAGAALDTLVASTREATKAENTGEVGPDPVLDAFLSGLEEWEKPAVMERLTTMLEGFERRDLVERLRERWSSP